MKMNVRTIAKKWWMNSRVFKKVGTVIALQSSDGICFSVPIVATVLAGDEGSGGGAYDPTPFSLLVFIGVGSS
jgi:hypothetical protein